MLVVTDASCGHETTFSLCLTVNVGMSLHLQTVIVVPVVNKLRIGHSGLTHSYFLSGDDPPTCQSCGIPLTVKHILVECTNLRDIREKCFTVSSVT